VFEKQAVHLVEVGLERFILRTVVRYMLLALYLLRVEPDAATGDHSWDYEELDPVPVRYAVAVADEDSDS